MLALLAVPDGPFAAGGHRDTDFAAIGGNEQGASSALLAVVGRQADLRRRLTGLLVQPEYPVAQMNCGEGGTTYVMLSDKEMVAIHHDLDIGGMERWSRP